MDFSTNGVIPTDQGVGRVQVNVKSKGQASGQERSYAQTEAPLELSFKTAITDKSGFQQILHREAGPNGSNLPHDADIKVKCPISVHTPIQPLFQGFPP